MVNFSIWAAVIIITIGAIWYCYLIFRARIDPPLSTWFISSIAISLSYGAYYDTSEPTLAGNLNNLLGVTEIPLIFLIILGAQIYRKTLVISLEPLQRYTLAASILIVLLWGFSDSGEFTFWAVQTLMVLAMIPTIGRAMTLEKNTDSTFLWGCIFIATIFGIVPSIDKGDPFGIVNSIRVIISSGIAVYFMTRLDLRVRRARKNKSSKPN